ncbi:MAG: M3 family metallopeptidase [Trueperaceae bacterium]|nr:M3 family metallopeptidase [Trueperaceae bacterium]
MNETGNPLLTPAGVPPFDAIRAEHVRPAVDAALADADAALDAIRRAEPPYRYDDLLGALDRLDQRLSRVTHAAAHLNAVRQDAAFREAWSGVLPDLAAFDARREADPDVYRVLRAYAASDEGRALDGERARYLDLTLDAMRRAGAAADADVRARVEAIRAELADLAQRFQNHLLDGVNAYAHDVTDPARLAGLPDGVVRRAAAAAEAAGVEGWRFTLQPPSLGPVLQHAEDRALRRTLYDAAQARGTGEGRDNRPLVGRILALRRELAHALGYAHFADLQLADRMAGDGATAQAFEADLWRRVEPHLRDEVDELAHAATERWGYDRLEPWDVAFLQERLRQERFDLDPEALRPYFALDRVLDAAFDLAHALYGLTVRPGDARHAWHDDVRAFDAVDEDGVHRGTFFVDPFPRDDKRGGAWMMPLVTGGPRPDGGFDPHVAAIAANLTPGDATTPSLLTHREAETVFHEVGHLLHHLLGHVETRSLSGIRVAWDFVELPSQLLENWLYDDAALARIARHADTGAPLPPEVRANLRAARTFGGAWQMARQLSLGTVDLALHVAYDPATDGDPVAWGRTVMAPFQIRPDAGNEGLLPAFQHVFAGGYAAGYYSYLWSEMLDADVFTRFEAAGPFDAATGRAFRDAVLAPGATRPPDALVRAFLGRDPDATAMLRRALGPDRLGDAA